MCDPEPSSPELQEVLWDTQVADLMNDGGFWSKEEESLVWSLTGMGDHFECMKPASDLVVKQWEIYDRGRLTSDISGQENGKQS